MPRALLTALPGAAWFGWSLRSAAAIGFPSVAVVDDHRPTLAILLYLVEAVLASALLWMRTGIALVGARRRAGPTETRDQERQRWALRKARNLAGAVVAVGIIGAPFLWMAALLGDPGTPWRTVQAEVIGRGQWIALVLLLSAIVDSLVAPVRSAEWLQSSVAMQMNRVILLHPVIMFGYGLFAITGSLLGMVGLFVVGRLLMDLNAMFGNAREGARKQWFERGGRLN
ncbi:hypothetical protein TBR22_A38070 [Luteitalea sp. TBR-22]|uniref:DUF6498-containing protein n=1 Tax=Luteitalea sp. TBR-22 TaxID=2802971 RepID=UPI001AF20ABB|nr:DUF6498-containing protein [Luteitalea sp. TBR-22]BCS34579.1 hypothetical protein TBR22_A38070 [Luteitalea sp. TBR-22]